MVKLFPHTKGRFKINSSIKGLSYSSSIPFVLNDAGQRGKEKCLFKFASEAN